MRAVQHDHRKKNLLRLVLGFGMVVLLLSAAEPHQALAQQANGAANQLFLPIVRSGGDAATVTPPPTAPPTETVTPTETPTAPPTETVTPTETPTAPPTETVTPTETATPTATAEPPPGEGALHLNDASIRSVGVAVDAQGGMHVVYAVIPPLLQEGKPVIYGYCAGGAAQPCGNGANWQFTAVADDFPFVQLALTPQGKPRLLLMRTVYPDGSSGTGGKLYRYAACDDACTNSASWQSLDVLVSRSGGGLYDADYSYRNFALDHLGRPRFVYEDRANSSGDHAGAYYVYCNADCTTPNTWFETRIDNDQYPIYIDEHTALRFTDEGMPRLLARDGGTFADLTSKLVYLACDAACEDGRNWQPPATLYGTGSGSEVYGWSLAVDHNGNPRATFYPRGGPLYYIWCNDECGQPGNWDGISLGLENASGRYTSLVLDAQDRPRFAFQDASENGIGYAWCEGACESTAGQWRGGVVETANDLNTAYPIQPLPTCTEATWISGHRPQLALDSAGNPRIAFDAENLQRCLRYPNDPNNPETFVETKWWGARLLFFPQP